MKRIKGQTEIVYDEDDFGTSKMVAELLPLDFPFRRIVITAGPWRFYDLQTTIQGTDLLMDFYATQWWVKATPAMITEALQQAKEKLLARLATEACGGGSTEEVPAGKPEIA